MPYETTDPRALVDRALTSLDESWFEAEAALFLAHDRGLPLETAATHADPVGRQMVQTATDMDAATRAALERATTYLDAAAQRFARTPAGVPPVAGVVANLTATFGPQLARPLALRLVQQRDMPSWRAMATLAYLDRHRDPTVVPSLVRFAAQTELAPQRDLAVRILGSIGGPTVASSVRTERERIAATGGTLPPELAALAGTARA